MGLSQLEKPSFTYIIAVNFKVRDGHLVQLLKQLCFFQWRAKVLNLFPAAVPSSGNWSLPKSIKPYALSSSKSLLKTFFCCDAHEPLPSVRRVVSCSEVCLLYNCKGAFPIHSHLVHLFHPLLLSCLIRTLLDLWCGNSFLLLFAKYLIKWNPFIWGF